MGKLLIVEAGGLERAIVEGNLRLNMDHRKISVVPTAAHALKRLNHGGIDEVYFRGTWGRTKPQRRELRAAL